MVTWPSTILRSGSLPAVPDILHLRTSLPFLSTTSSTPLIRTTPRPAPCVLVFELTASPLSFESRTSAQVASLGILMWLRLYSLSLHRYQLGACECHGTLYLAQAAILRLIPPTSADHHMLIPKHAAKAVQRVWIANVHPVSAALRRFLVKQRKLVIKLPNIWVAAVEMTGRQAAFVMFNSWDLNEIPIRQK